MNLPTTWQNPLWALVGKQRTYSFGKSRSHEVITNAALPAIELNKSVISVLL